MSCPFDRALALVLTYERVDLGEVAAEPEEPAQHAGQDQGHLPAKTTVTIQIPSDRETPFLGIKSVMVSVKLLPSLHRSIAKCSVVDPDPDPVGSGTF